MLHAGIDLGSKTVKLVVLDDGLEVLYSSYERHLSNVFETLAYTLKNASVHFPCEAMTSVLQVLLVMRLPSCWACRSLRRSFRSDRRSRR